MCDEGLYLGTLGRLKSGWDMTMYMTLTVWVMGR